MTETERRAIEIGAGIAGVGVIGFMILRSRSGTTTPPPTTTPTSSTTTTTAPSVQVSNIQYHLSVVTSANVLKPNQSLSITVEPLVSWQENGVTNTGILGGQAISLTGTLGTFTLQTPNLSPNPGVMPSSVGRQGNSISHTFTNTPKTPQFVTETVQWTDPSGAKHQQVVKIPVEASVYCPERLVFSQGYPLPSWLTGGSNQYMQISGLSSQSTACPFVAATVTTQQNGQTQKYLVAVIGGSSSSLVQRALTNLGWQNVKVIKSLGGTLTTQNNVPALPLNTVLSAQA